MNGIKESFLSLDLLSLIYATVMSNTPPIVWLQQTSR